MTMFMNLDTIPAGKSMFTVAWTDAPVDTPKDEQWYEEYDLVFKTSASSGTIATYATARPDWPYEGGRIVGVANQSDGYVLREDWAGIK